MHPWGDIINEEVIDRELLLYTECHDRYKK